MSGSGDGAGQHRQRGGDLPKAEPGRAACPDFVMSVLRARRGPGCAPQPEATALAVGGRARGCGPSCCGTWAWPATGADAGADSAARRGVTMATAAGSGGDFGVGAPLAGAPATATAADFGSSCDAGPDAIPDAGVAPPASACIGVWGIWCASVRPKTTAGGSGDSWRRSTSVASPTIAKPARPVAAPPGKTLAGSPAKFGSWRNMCTEVAGSSTEISESGALASTSASTCTDSCPASTRSSENTMFGLASNAASDPAPGSTITASGETRGPADGVALIADG